MLIHQCMCGPFASHHSQSGVTPGACITTVTRHCHKNFSQWEHSFQRKLRYHWLKGLRQRQIAVIRQGPVLSPFNGWESHPVDNVRTTTPMVPHNFNQVVVTYLLSELHKLKKCKGSKVIIWIWLPKWLAYLPYTKYETNAKTSGRQDFISMAPRRCGSYIECPIFKLILQNSSLDTCSEIFLWLMPQNIIDV